MVAKAELDTTRAIKSSYAEMQKAGARAVGMSGLTAHGECCTVPLNREKGQPPVSIATPRMKDVNVQHSSLQGVVEMPRSFASQLRVSSPLIRSESDFSPSRRRIAKDNELRRRTLLRRATDTVCWVNRSDVLSESKEDNITLKSLRIDEAFAEPKRMNEPDSGRLLGSQHAVTMSMASSRRDYSSKSMSKRWEIIFTVPADARCGDQISCDVPNGSIATAIVPAGHEPGDKFISIFPPLPGKAIHIFQSNKDETDKCFKCELYRVRSTLCFSQVNCAGVALNPNCMFEFTNHHTDALSLCGKIVSCSYRTQAGFESHLLRMKQCGKSVRTPAITFVSCAVDHSEVRRHLKRTVHAYTSMAIIQRYRSNPFTSETSFLLWRLIRWDTPAPRK